MSSVWVQLYYKGEEQPVGDADPIEIEPIPKNVNALKEKVIEKAKTMLGVQVYNLFIYPVETVPPVSNDTEYLQANTPGAEAAEGSSYEKPLIVIAPKPEQQDGELRCCFCILESAFLYSKCRVVVRIALFMILFTNPSWY
jgi:hypothetical protein